MRYVSILCGAFLVFAWGTGAQLGPASSFLFGSPSPALAAPAPIADAAAPKPTANLLALSAPADPPQGVYGVFQDFNFQVYGGYTFLRFYALPNFTDNMNGFNFGVVYYPGGRRIGADGEFVAAFGSSSGVSSKFASGMGGARFRFSAPRGLEAWVHGLVGGAHFLPQTPYGGLGAFSYELGGGIDLMPHHRRLGYRIQADMLGTRFFGTYQYSPKISAGIVYKF
jgi:hypothetical protein